MWMHRFREIAALLLIQPILSEVTSLPEDPTTECLSPSILTEWTPWGLCSVSCGSGKSLRDRECNEDTDCPDALDDCEGAVLWEYRDCEEECCVIPVYWGSWGQWSGCSQSCGYGSRDRSRTCTTTSCPGDTTCDGSNSDWELCIENENQAPSWSTWSSWTDCSASCGHGRSTRSRTCVPASPCDDGTGCTGSNYEERDCDLGCCEVARYWGPWSVWSDCSVTCGYGVCTRDRTCIEPYCPEDGYCIGEDWDQEFCFMGNCQGCDEEHITTLEADSTRISVSVDGPSYVDDFNDLSDETDGSYWLQKTHVTTDKIIVTFTHPVALLSVHVDTKFVDFVTLTADSDDSVEWSTTESISDPHEFSESSLEPELAPRDGVTELTLTFITDYYKFKVKDLEIKICEDNDCHWRGWSPWSLCDKVCGNGRRRSHERCTCMPRSDPDLCHEFEREKFEYCNEGDCEECMWGMWSSWSDCSNDCGTGYQEAHRECQCPDDTEYNAQYCSYDEGGYTKTQLCENPECSHCEWTSWESSHECYGCENTLTRNCKCPTIDSVPCEGPFDKTESCCHDDDECDWWPWESWGNCYAGSRTSTRTGNCRSQYGYSGERTDEKSEECEGHGGVAIVNRNGDCLDEHLQVIKNGYDDDESQCCLFRLRENDSGELVLSVENSNENSNENYLDDLLQSYHLFESDSLDGDELSIQEWYESDDYAVVRDEYWRCGTVDYSGEWVYGDSECDAHSSWWKIVECDDSGSGSSSSGAASTRDLAIAGVVLGALSLAIICTYIIYELVR